MKRNNCKKTQRVLDYLLKPEKRAWGLIRSDRDLQNNGGFWRHL